MDVSVDLGPSAKADAGVFLEDEGGDQLLIVSKRGGCLTILGAGLILAAANSQASIVSGRFEWWDLVIGIPMGILGGWLLFGRNWIRLDRKRRFLDTGISIVTPHLIRRSLLGKYTRVVVKQTDSVSTDSDGHSTTTTTFPVTLEGGPGVPKMSLSSAGIWEQSIPVSEAVSRFLQVPLEDKANRRTQLPGELDLPLREQAPPRKVGKKLSRPKAARSEIHEHSDHSIDLSVPRPQGRQWLMLLLLISVLWCIPVGLLSRSLFTTLLPLVVVGATAIKCVFGFRSELKATPDELRVKTYGLIFRRTALFPSSELEDLLVRGLEQGGPRTSMAQMMDGVIIARSDREAIRFGHGLDLGELKWLRQELHRILTLPTDAENPATIEINRPPRVINWAPAYIGWFAGAAMATLVGGYLTMGVTLPFMEHLLNLGALLGLLAGLIFLSTRYDRARQVTTRVLQLIVVFVLAMDLTDLLQWRPSFDAIRLLKYGPRDPWFYLGWIPIAAGISLLLAEAVQWAIDFGFRRRKRARR